MQDEILEVARQLLKSRLRHYLYETKANECGPSEQMWRSLLSWQGELVAAAEVAWQERLTQQPRPSPEIVLRAFCEAVEDVRESVTAQREALEPLIQAFESSFDPQSLLGATVESE